MSGQRTTQRPIWSANLRAWSHPLLSWRVQKPTFSAAWIHAKVMIAASVAPWLRLYVNQ